MFGQSQNNQQPNQQQEQFKTSSIYDPNPYGQSSIWTGLPAPTQDNSKPLFTPLVATQKLKESAQKPLPALRLNQSRYMTPPRRNGYGFSYSTYGTPSSVTSTPGGVSLSGSAYSARGLNNSSFGRSFSRSASVQNLRSTYNEDSSDVWKPNALGSSHRHSAGSIKRLTIDRSIRQDLFTRPSQLALPSPAPAHASTPAKEPEKEKTSESTQTNGETTAEPSRKLNKRVSFENDKQSTSLNGETGALVRTEIDSDEEPTPRQSSKEPRNGDLASVPEDREAHPVSAGSRKAQAKPDPVPGDYWMKPTRAEISKLPRAEAQNFKGFQVGRENCGHVTFNGAVDLTKLDFDKLYEDIVEVRLRSITVYPDSATKPPPGKGLNVPSSLHIENSWPRVRGKPSSETTGPQYEKHIKRLKAMGGTKFTNYDNSTGVWTFTVEHYTRYGLDYDEDDGESMMDDQSELKPPPSSLQKAADASIMEIDDNDNDNDSFVHDDGNDTFAFKKSVPGGFGKHIMIEEEETNLPSDGASSPQTNGSDDSAYSEDDLMSEDEASPSMPGALPLAPVLTNPTKAIAKSVQPPGTPGRPLLNLEGDWVDQLQRTISPRKQNRDVLRDVQARVLLDRNFSPIKPQAAQSTKVKSSIDLMNNMFSPVSSRSRQVNMSDDSEFEV